ncbi:MAG: sugar kinase [Actinomycetota bacterium]|nr:sugar kinase [Actinomycetota bacterium]
MAQIVPPPGLRLGEAEELRLGFAGAESTVSLYLAHLGHRVTYLSRLGRDPFGDMIEHGMVQGGVDTTWIERDSSRNTGVYFKDARCGTTTVYYYRANSAASALTSTALVPELLDGVALVHISGITPALSTTCRALTEKLFQLRDQFNFEISFDVNYRPQLWPDGDAPEVLRELAKSSDLVLVGLDEAQSLWGTPQPADVRNLLGSANDLIVKDGPVGAWYFHGNELDFEKALEVPVLEPVGAGDSFAAGVLHGRLTGASVTEMLRRGHCMAARTLQSTADFVVPEEDHHAAEH